MYQSSYCFNLLIKIKVTANKRTSNVIVWLDCLNKCICNVFISCFGGSYHCFEQMLQSYPVLGNGVGLTVDYWRTTVDKLELSTWGHSSYMQVRSTAIEKGCEIKPECWTLSWMAALPCKPKARRSSLLIRRIVGRTLHFDAQKLQQACPHCTCRTLWVKWLSLLLWFRVSFPRGLAYDVCEGRSSRIRRIPWGGAFPSLCMRNHTCPCTYCWCKDLVGLSSLLNLVLLWNLILYHGVWVWQLRMDSRLNQSHDCTLQ